MQVYACRVPESIDGGGGGQAKNAILTTDAAILGNTWR